MSSMTLDFYEYLILKKIEKTTTTTFIRCIDARFEQEIGFF